MTRERWRLDTQFTGGFDTVFFHSGQKTVGGESNRLTTGRGIGALGVPLAGRFGGGANTLQLNKRFATAGEMVAGIANAFTWEFTNGNVNFAGSLLSSSFVQPLLRGAGRSNCTGRPDSGRTQFAGESKGLRSVSDRDFIHRWPLANWVSGDHSVADREQP